MCEVYTVNNAITLPLPFYMEGVMAGFPSPAENYLDKSLDLNEHLVKHPAATFYVRVRGSSMQNAGMHDGDILIVDRSLEAAPGKIIIAVLNGEFTVKRLLKQNGKIILAPENEKYANIVIEENADFEIWGVVTNIIHAV